MKSKLLKLKQMFYNYWTFVGMYVTGGVSMFLGVYRHSLGEVLLAASFILSVIGWHMERRRSMKYLSSVKAVSELIKNNNELYEQTKLQHNLIAGLVSERNDLKLKLKNAKMESARLRNNGGRKDE